MQFHLYYTVWAISIKVLPMSQIQCDTCNTGLTCVLSPAVCIHLPQHLGVATVLLVMYSETSIDYWYRPTVIDLPA